MKRDNCNELLKLTDAIEPGFWAPLENISKEFLNHSFALHKMTIGQIALHCSAWASYFIAEEKPWEVQKWTCRPVEYPLTLDVVNQSIKEGFLAIKNKLNSIDDEILEIENKEKGKGYIIYRLLIHFMAHGNQMAYLRQLLEPDWDFGSHFGDSASAIINTKYSTMRDIDVRGF